MNRSLAGVSQQFAQLAQSYRSGLGFEPEADRDEALAELAQWLETQTATDRFDQAAAELAERGLTR